MKHSPFRVLGPLVAVAAILATIIPSGVSAQSGGGSGVVSEPFTLTASNPYSPTLNMNGHNTCSAIIYTGSGFTVTAQSASDSYAGVPAMTWNTATNIGTAGAITALGTTGGNVAAQGLGNTSFRLYLSTAGTGAVSGVESCTSAGAGSSTTIANFPSPCPTDGNGYCFVDVVGTVTVNTPPPCQTFTFGVCGAFVPEGPLVEPSSTPAGLTLQTYQSNGAANVFLFSPSPLPIATSTANPIPVTEFRNTNGLITQTAACTTVISVAISTATTTKIGAVAGAGANVHICSYDLYLSGTTLPTFFWEDGTGTACNTVSDTLTGTYGGTTSAQAGQDFANGSGLGEVLHTATTNTEFCIVTSGTAPSVQGRVTLGVW